METHSQIEIFKNKLTNIQQSNLGIIGVSQAAIKLCREELCNLRSQIKLKGFNSENEEIQFFKHIKQIPLSYLIYYLEIYAFECCISKMSIKQHQKFIDKLRNKRYQFIMDHIDFVNYMEQGQTHLDMCYFKRNQSIQIMMMHTDDYFYDLDFNTSHDMLLSKVNAYKRFIDYLENRLKYYTNTLNYSTLKWTSSKAALTELIYALYHSRSVNNGKLEIRELAAVLQKLFNFELGDFYRIYSEIKLRKNSRTKFLDELSLSLINEMKKDDL